MYGIDVVLPGMKYASVERPPSYGGSVRNYDASDALKVPGVERVVQIPGTPPPSGFKPLGGVAVIASNTWAAMQGRQQLHIDWEPGPNADYDTTSYRAELEKTAREPGHVARDNGDTVNALRTAAKHVSADYFVPHLAHAMMEPESCTAMFATVAARCGRRRRNPQQARTTVAEVLGVDQSNVTVNVTLLGGRFRAQVETRLCRGGGVARTRRRCACEGDVEPRG